jgi:hypothetical protein
MCEGKDENWTKDKDGNYVNWLKPPYRTDYGQSILVLEGEDPQQIPNETRKKRILEYTKLCRREQLAALKRNNQRT